MTYSQGVDHGLEAKVDLSAADDLGHVRRVVGLEDGDFDALILEVALGLGKVKGGVVWRRMPVDTRSQMAAALEERAVSSYQLVRKVILSVAMVIGLIFTEV